MQQVRRCKATLYRFVSEKRQAGHTPSAIFGAFVNMYMFIGAQAIGAVNLADRIENWAPEHLAKLRDVGLRSSFELDDEEGHIFVALADGYHPVGVMGLCSAVGDLFVSSLVVFPYDSATAVDKIKQSGAELILGLEAKELLRKMEQVKGVAPRADKIEELWEVENWGHDEWKEQVIAELAFSEAMNVQYVFELNKLFGSVAGYRVRRAPNGLVLVPADNDEDIFVAVEVEATKGVACILGWLRGSEGKVSQFFQKNCWIVPREALHDLEELPGKEKLRAMPPYQEPSP